MTRVLLCRPVLLLTSMLRAAHVTQLPCTSLFRVHMLTYMTPVVSAVSPLHNATPTASSAVCACQYTSCCLHQPSPCIVVPAVCPAAPFLPSPPPLPRLSTSVAKPQVQVVTHLCYSDFQDIMQAVDDMDGEGGVCWGLGG
jgi:hypothetical protein